jgi:MerR family transcriptional regulator, heat shock protein HspR
MSDGRPDSPTTGSTPGSTPGSAPASSHALYSISVASELSGVDPQMLRIYEQRGLLSPFRTDGGTRRYSAQDLERVAVITSLLGEGLNLAGIGHVLQLRAQTSQLTDELGELRATTTPDRQEVRRLRRENRDLRAEIARLDPGMTPEAGQEAPRSQPPDSLSEREG